MVPPFLAYYGVITRNRTMVGEAYKQIKLYRQYLIDPSQGLWRHIVLGTSLDEPPNDPGFWSTGGLLLFSWKNKTHATSWQGTGGQRQACCGFTPPLNDLNTQTRSSMNYKTSQTGFKRFMRESIPTLCV